MFFFFFLSICSFYGNSTCISLRGPSFPSPGQAPEVTVHDMWGWLVSTVLSFWSHGKFKDEKWPQMAQTQWSQCSGFGRKRWSLFPDCQSLRECLWELLASKWQQKGERRARYRESQLRDGEARPAGSGCCTEPCTHPAVKGLPLRRCPFFKAHQAELSLICTERFSLTGRVTVMVSTLCPTEGKDHHCVLYSN